jgi:glycosyltransferase involved in cell wall biosynthesis
LRTAKNVISLSTAFKKELIAVGVEDRKIRVVGSSIDANWNRDAARAGAPELRQRWGLHKDERIILSVGRLSREKGHLDLVRAFAQLSRAANRPLRLLIIGDGPERARLESEAVSLGIADRVLMPGHVNDVAPVYQLADVFVLPSFSEGSPLALLEAMVSGLPAVATAVGGVPEMVNAECAVLTEAGNPNALAAAISRVLSDPGFAERLRINAREAALNNYGPDGRACKLLEVYEEVLK